MPVFRVEKNNNFTIMSNYHLRDKNLSLKAKGLLSQMLSLPEDWDYTLAGLAHINKESIDAIRTATRELEWAGYITRKQGRDATGKMTPIEYTIYEHPQHPATEQPDELDRPELENPTPDDQPLLSYPISVSPAPDDPLSENPGQLIIDRSIIKASSTDESIIDPSINFEKVRNDAIYTYRQLIKRNIEYDCLIEEYGTERMDNVVELILETVLSNRPYIRVAGDDHPREYVTERLLSVRSSHLQYVFSCLDQTATKVYNIKSYLLTALFNAPATKDSYYRAEVNYDLYGT